MGKSLFSVLVGLSAVFASHPETDVQGDPLPEQAAARIGTVRLRHGNQFGSVAFSPDGAKIVSTDWYSVCVWDSRTGRSLAFRLLAPQYGCWPVVSRDGLLIACRLENGALGVQETASGKRIASFPSKNGRVHNLIFSRDNRWLASTDDEGTISLWDVVAGKLRHQWQSPQKGYASHQAFTPDGKHLMHATHGGHLFLWDVQTAKEVWSVKPKKKGDYYFNGLDISPDGQTAAIMHRWLRIELWNVKTGKFLREFEANGSWHGPIFSPDGTHLLCGTHNREDAILFWDVATGKLARKLAGDPKGYPASLALSPDGTFLAAAGSDHAIHLWNLATGKELFPIEKLGGDVSVRFLTDGKTLVSHCDYGANIDSGTLEARYGFWNLQGKLVKELTFDPNDAQVSTLSPDAKMLVLGEGGSFRPFFRVLANGELQCTLRLHETTSSKKLQDLKLRSAVHELEFSPDGRFLFASMDNPGPNATDYHRLPVVQVWKQSSPTALEKKAEHIAIGAWSGRFVCAPDSRWIGVATPTGWNFYECETGKLLRSNPGNTRAVRAASPSGRVLACADDDERTASVVEFATGKAICKLDCHPRYLVRPRFAVSVDGRLVASDLNSETIFLFDAFSGKQVGRLEGHRGDIRSLCFSPDGRYLVSGSSDTTALIWDYHKALPRAVLKVEPLPADRVEQLWLDLQADDAARGYRAVVALLRSPDRAIALLRKKLAPATADEQRRLQPWIDDLGNDNFIVRERAASKLAKLGALAEPALRLAQTKAQSLEVKRRIKAVLGSPDGLPAPLWLATLRGLETLELIRTPAARTLLEELSNGLPESLQTQEARRSLDRIRK